jgi:myo-inositol-1(or 4)-monophosphatase
MQPDLNSLLDCAVTAAKKAGQHGLDNLTRRGEVLTRADHDVKLALDVECQEIAEQEILSRYPEHHFLGEESIDVPKPDPDTPYLWIVDPIDGTVNFSHAYPYWSCSIAVQRAGEVVAGCVYNPVSDECYSATSDSPAQRNGKSIAVSQTAALSQALVMTGTNKCETTDLPSGDVFLRIAKAVQRPRIAGSAALDICRVACGQADAYFETAIFVWDVAAAGLIVRQSGGRTELLRELPTPHCISYIATNGHLHDAFSALVTGS